MIGNYRKFVFKLTDGACNGEMGAGATVAQKVNWEFGLC
jgi:hypothetical protein